MITVLDRDGVLVASCAANLAAYTQASKEIGLSFDKAALEKSIHCGDSINEFREFVWGKIPDIKFEQLKMVKAESFTHLLPLIEINPFWSKVIQISPNKFYVATKASFESSRFLVNSLIPEFNVSHIFSTQNSEFSSKVEILARVSQMNNLLHDELTLYDDSPKTVALAIAAGFNAELVQHFCGG